MFLLFYNAQMSKFCVIGVPFNILGVQIIYSYVQKVFTGP